jgi:hypothetical protein
VKQLTLIFLFVLAGCRPVQNTADVSPRPLKVRVIDNMTKEPVAGAVVKCRGTEAVSDAKGFALFTCAPDDPLTITSERYRKHEMPVPWDEEFQVAIDLHDDHVEFAGGVSSFYNHFTNKITYPHAARSAKAQGKVWVEFVIEPDGRSKLVHVHDPSHFFTKEITRVFESMPAGWGQKYAGMTFLLPVTFVIADHTALDEDFSPLTVERHRVMSELVVTAHLN